MARKRMSFSGAKAVRDLGMPQTPIDRALAEAIDWFRARGMAPDPGVQAFRRSGVQALGTSLPTITPEHLNT